MPAQGVVVFVHLCIAPVKAGGHRAHLAAQGVELGVRPPRAIGLDPQTPDRPRVGRCAVPGPLARPGRRRAIGPVFANLATPAVIGPFGGDLVGTGEAGHQAKAGVVAAGFGVAQGIGDAGGKVSPVVIPGLAAAATESPTTDAGFDGVAKAVVAVAGGQGPGMARLYHFFCE